MDRDLQPLPYLVKCLAYGIKGTAFGALLTGLQFLVLLAVTFYPVSGPTTPECIPCRLDCFSLLLQYFMEKFICISAIHCVNCIRLM